MAKLKHEFPLQVAKIPFVVRGTDVLISRSHGGRYPRTCFWCVEYSHEPEPGANAAIAQLEPFPDAALILNPDVGSKVYTGGNRGMIWGPGAYSCRKGRYPTTLSTSVGGDLILYYFPGDCDCMDSMQRSQIPLPRTRSVLPATAFIALEACRVGRGTVAVNLFAGQSIPGWAVWCEPIGNTAPIVGSGY